MLPLGNNCYFIEYYLHLYKQYVRIEINNLPTTSVRIIQEEDLFIFPNDHLYKEVLLSQVTVILI